MKTTVLAVVFCLGIVVPASGFNEPDNFAGIKFGEDVRTQVLSCEDSTNTIPLAMPMTSPAGRHTTYRNRSGVGINRDPTQLGAILTASAKLAL